MPAPTPWHVVLYLMYLMCNCVYIFFYAISGLRLFLSLSRLYRLLPPPSTPHPPRPPLPRLLSLLPVIDAPRQFAGCPHLFPPRAARTPTRGQNPAPFPSISVHSSAQKQGQRGQGVAPSSTIPAPSGACAGQCPRICVAPPPALYHQLAN